MENSMPSINGTYQLSGFPNNVVINKITSNEIFFTWWMNGVRQTTRMSLQHFYELSPVKTGSI